jgi:hypothetical protein
VRPWNLFTQIGQDITAKTSFIHARQEPPPMPNFPCLARAAAQALIIMAATMTGTAYTASSPANGDWVAELQGPVQRCQVPQRILFVSGDAIIGGKIMFGGRAYYPRGRMEETLETSFALVRRYGDPAPLVSISGRADGGWNGEWAAAGEGCTGTARIFER